MLISKEWLSDYIKTELSDEGLTDILTSTGLEVEKIEQVDQIKGGLKGVVVGEIVSLSKHPNADRLSCTKITIGTEDPLNIVCGASNIAVGQKVPVATIGCTIYPESIEKGIKIKKGKIRGQLSEGMLCAEDELGIGKSHDGIYILGNDAISGTPLSEYLGLKSDSIFEIGLTPNRMDAMSHMGVARDLRAAAIHRKIKYIWNENNISEWSKADSNIEINIQDKYACPRYRALSVSGLKNISSPDWLKRRLKAIGLKPINAIVDITNYVLNDKGHPLHAFDTQKIIGNSILIRRAKSNEELITLDGVTRKLHKEDLVIADKQVPLALAGVFGGQNSGVNEDSTDIIIESAWFDPVVIRKTAKRHGLNTDASFRYERGVDPNIGMDALVLAWKLINEIFPNATITGFSEKSLNNSRFDNRIIEVDLTRITKLIGLEINQSEVISILNSLDISSTILTKSTLELSIPAYRWDVTREADIAEEILRIYGFNSIPFPERMRLSLAENEVISNESLRRKATDYLVANGLYEIMNNSLTSSELYSNHPSINSENNVKILNPLSQELEIMRPTLLMGGLNAISYNLKRQESNISIFEFGRVYASSQENNYSEKNHLGIWLSGQFPRPHWSKEKTKVDFFTLKGISIGLLSCLGIDKINEIEQEPIAGKWAGGIRLESGQKVLATISWVDEWALKKSDVKEAVLAGIFHWDNVCQIAKISKVQYKETPKFPKVTRDLAIIVKSEIKYESIKLAIKKSKEKTLIDFELFDVFQGEKIGKARSSFGVRLIFQDLGRTLKDSQIEKSVSRIIDFLKSDVDAEIRS